MHSQPRRPIGRITAALTLIAVGGGLLASIFGLLPDALVLLKLWPFLLVSLGGELLVARYQGARTRFDWGGLSLLVLFIALLSSGAAAKHVLDGGGFSGRFFFTGSQTSDQVSFPLTPTVKQVKLEAESGTVTLRSSAGSAVNVQANFWGNAVGTESPRVRLREQGEVLYVGVTSGDWSNVSAQYEVELPAGLSIEVVGQSGQIRAEGIKGALTLRNHSGMVSVERGEGDLVLSTNSGLIQVSDHQGPIKADAHSGAIRLTDINGSVDARTNSGLISLILAPGMGAKVAAETNSGLIRGPQWLQVDSRDSRRSATGQVGNGAGSVRLTTGSGSITVETH